MSATDRQETLTHTKTMNKPTDTETTGAAQSLSQSALLDALVYVANECQKHPMDSVRDILNEAFKIYDLPLLAKWSDDSDNPIHIQI